MTVALASVIAELFFQTFPYPEGATLVGISKSRQRVHNYYTALGAYEVTPAQLEIFVTGTPGMAVRKSEQIEDAVIDASVADAVFLGRAPFITAWSIAQVHGRNINLGREYGNQLIAAGIVRPLSEPALAGREPLFSRLEFDRDMDAFTAPYAK